MVRRVLSCIDNRLTRVADWDGGITAYDYDAAGQLITTTLPNGVVSVNLYDDAGRLIQIEHRDGLGGCWRDTNTSWTAATNGCLATACPPWRR